MHRPAVIRLALAAALAAAFTAPAPTVIEYRSAERRLPARTRRGADGIVCTPTRPRATSAASTRRPGSSATSRRRRSNRGRTVSSSPPTAVCGSPKRQRENRPARSATDSIKEYTLPAAARDPHTPLWHEGKLGSLPRAPTCTASSIPRRVSLRCTLCARARARPYGLVAGRDGGLWIALFGTNSIGRIDPANGTIRLFPIPDSTVARASGGRRPGDRLVHRQRARPLGAARSPDRRGAPVPVTGRRWQRTLWHRHRTRWRILYNEGNNNQIVTFDPQTQAMTTVAFPRRERPCGTWPSIRRGAAVAGRCRHRRIGRIDLGTK